jgi:endonuclease/exonuclease/phosphatase family metal-dependent hydrolase
MGELSIATFNAENFYMLIDRPYSAEAFFALSDDEYKSMNASIFNPNKDRFKIAAIARTISEENFDFVGLCEVGGMETLANFNRYYLDERYECFLHEENSTRGIFVGALIKKGRFEQVRAKNMRGDFSRNMLKVSLRADGADLDFFVVHLKSPLGPDLGIERRVQELRQLCRLVGRSGCVVLGDFNGIAIRGEHQFEFEPFLDLPFRDVLEHLGIPAESRYTHFYFGDGPSFNQLDYIFCSNDLAILGGGAIADIIPLNYEQRSRLPSDHLFLKALIGLDESPRTA